MIKRRILSAVMAAAVSVSALAAVSTGVSAEWVKSGDSYSYKDDATGKKLTGWQTIEGGKYYFDKKGNALTGWKIISEKTYYFNSAKKGKMLTGWSTIGGKKYYFGTDGSMRTGFVKLEGKTYYFGTDGAMRTGKLKISGKTYDFGSDGVMKSGSGKTTTSSSSSSTLTAPFKGLKWNMSCDQAIKAGKFKNYYVTGNMLIVADSKPEKYYVFDQNDKLQVYGYMSDDAEKYPAVFKKYFKDAGWKNEGTYNQDGQKIVIYLKGDSAGCLSYTDDFVMTMIFSDKFTQDIIDGKDVSEIIGM